MQDIAKWIDETKALSRLTGFAALCLAASTLSGCLGAGLDFAGSTTVDRTVATGSVPPAMNDEDNSDAITVRNAVSSADVSKIAGNPIPWANSTSGSAGVISSIAEEQVNGTTCRRFTTTRHSYQGIAKFDGNTCLLGNGDWYLTSFGPRS
ncbi:RT0821/Lpp0805 family surface protein [Rhizobium herbae]|uniref:Surface antigen n=1 Tax=Rhizobium herbae TaxID=508661 RepID=A0ABS4ENM6_9HYPH|nr:RT0821/Lpp0805 family surface protein [Rhizobium herbae]MBP1859558.1 surface antigen [Rhizobium herbae]